MLNVNLTDAALNQAKAMLKETDGKLLRVYFEGGGCSGLQIQIKVEGEINPDDTLVPLSDAMKLIVDPISIQYLTGTTINYLGEGELARFIVEGMQLRSGCPGCGGH